MFYSTIDEKTFSLLKKIQSIPELADTRLVGGTGLALQIGHRISVDLDLFGTWDFEGSLEPLLDHCGTVVVNNIQRIMQFFTIDGIKTDFVRYDYPWIGDAVIDDGIRVASIEDIGAMKINAIINRGTRKDFIDMAFLLREYNLDSILGWFKMKYSDGNIGTALRSLAFFDDAETMPMPKMISKMTWDECKHLINEKLSEFAK